MSEVLSACFPEFIILIFIVLNLLGTIFLGTHLYKLSKWTTLLGIVLALVSTFYLQIEPEIYVLGGSFLTNTYTVFFKILILLVGFFLTLLSKNLLRENRDKAFPYFTVLLTGLFFSMCAISSVNLKWLLCVIVALGLINISMFFFNKQYVFKYLAFEYLSQYLLISLLFILGIYGIYSVCGSLQFEQISSFLLNTVLFDNFSQIILVSSVVLIISSLLFNLGVSPFSSWVSSVFSKSDAPICVYLSIIPIIVSFGVLARLLMLFLNYAVALKVILAFLAVVTILLNSLAATRAVTLKYLMARSMSVQSGIMLLGLCAFSVYSLSSVLFYLFCYVFVNIGVWAAIILLYDSENSDKLEDLYGVIYHRPYYVVSFTILLFCLAGLAPTCGFVAKLYIFSAVARSGMIYLPFLMVALLATVVMLYAYWRVVRSLFKRVDTTIAIDTHLLSSKFILYCCTIFCIVVCFYSDQLIYLCQLVAYYM